MIYHNPFFLFSLLIGGLFDQSSEKTMATSSSPPQSGTEVVAERRGIPAASFVKDVQAYLNQLGLDVNSTLAFQQERSSIFIFIPFVLFEFKFIVIFWFLFAFWRNLRSVTVLLGFMSEKSADFVFKICLSNNLKFLIKLNMNVRCVFVCGNYSGNKNMIWEI